MKSGDLKVFKNVNVKQSRKGVLLFECENKEALNSVKTNIETVFGARCTTKVANKYNPQIRIKGVYENDVNDDNIITNIIQQNEIDDKGDEFCLKVVNKTKPIRHQLDVFIEADPETFKKIINKTRIHLGLQLCRAEEAFKTLRCFKCQKYFLARMESSVVNVLKITRVQVV